MDNHMDENDNTDVSHHEFYCDKSSMNGSVVSSESLTRTQTSMQRNDRAISLCLTWILASPIFFQIALWITVSSVFHAFSKEILCFMILALSQLLAYLTYLVIRVYKDCDYLENRNPTFVSSTKENLNFKIITSSAVLILGVGLLYLGLKSWANSLLIGVLLSNILTKKNIDSTNHEHASKISDRKWDKRRARSANSDKLTSSSSMDRASHRYRTMLGYCRSSSTPPGIDTIKENE